MKSVLNPVAIQEPAIVVSRPTTPPNAYNTHKTTMDLDLYTPDAVTEYSQWPVAFPEAFYATNLRLNVLTNGIISVPAKTLFYAKHLLHGVHWMRYDENHATPTHPWFYPRDDSWFLGSTDTKESVGQSRSQLDRRVHGVVFRRIGRADTINKCVPVVMAISNFQVDYTLSVA